MQKTCSLGLHFLQVLVPRYRLQGTYWKYEGSIHTALSSRASVFRVRELLLNHKTQGIALESQDKPCNGLSCNENDISWVASGLDSQHPTSSYLSLQNVWALYVWETLLRGIFFCFVLTSRNLKYFINTSSSSSYIIFLFSHCKEIIQVLSLYGTQ